MIQHSAQRSNKANDWLPSILWKLIPDVMLPNASAVSGGRNRSPLVAVDVSLNRNWPRPTATRMCFPKTSRPMTVRCIFRTSSGGLETVKPYSWRIMFTMGAGGEVPMSPGTLGRSAYVIEIACMNRLGLFDLFHQLITQCLRKIGHPIFVSLGIPHNNLAIPHVHVFDPKTQGLLQSQA